jgi:hypothetical protein
MRLFLALLFCVMASHAYAQEEEVAADDNCNPYTEVPVSITPSIGEVTYDYGTDIEGLKELKTIPHFYESFLLAVTTFKPDIGVTNYPKTIQMPDGSSCIKITHVDIKLNYEEVVTHVASEIPLGSCAFTEVLQHEQKHVLVNRAIFAEYAPIIQQKLQAYLKSAGMVQGQEYGYAMKLLHDKLKELVNNELHEMQTAEWERQKAVDTKEEFAHLVKACNGQLGQIAAQFRQSGQ